MEKEERRKKRINMKEINIKEKLKELIELYSLQCRRILVGRVDNLFSIGCSGHQL